MQKIKCVVWDLDNTLWDGVLLEDKKVILRQGIRDIIESLDNRGILQSISSKNDYDIARNKLIEFDLWEYFIYPQISWDVKSESVKTIAESINIGLDTIAFVDDQEFELEEVKFSHPQVLCINAVNINNILDMEVMKPNYITRDSKNRRKMYKDDISRNSAQKNFIGNKEEFLRTLKMQFMIHNAREEDLQRMEELTVRTHQMNSTGYIYSYDELKQFISDENYELVVVQLDDIYGSYGKIGLAMVEKLGKYWELKLLLMSCRVMSKGVGNVLLNHLINKARKNGAILRAQFIPTNTNRIMYITYKFNGFHEVDTRGEVILLEADMSYERKMPDYITFIERST